MAAKKKVNFFQSKRQELITLAVLILVITALYFAKGFFVAAVVNGKAVSRFAVVKELEKQGGGQVLQSLIQRELILQEAKKQKLTVSQEEIDAELAKAEESLKASGTTLDQALAQRGLTKADVVDQIRTQKLVEKLLGDQIEVSDQELADYVKENKLEKEDANMVKEQLRQQRLYEKYQSFVTNLESSAKINYWVNY